MKVVYVCSPLSGDIEGNMRKAADFCAFTKDLGYVPYAPHLLFTDFMDDTIETDRTLAIQMGNEMLKRCDEFWAFIENKCSAGMQAELGSAREMGMPIRLFYQRTKGDVYVPVMKTENIEEQDFQFGEIRHLNHK